MIQGKVPCADKVMRNWPNSGADCNVYWGYCSDLELETAQDVCAAADVCIRGVLGRGETITTLISHPDSL